MKLSDFLRIFALSLVFVALPATCLAIFYDVAADNQHADAILFAQEHGIVDGYPDGTFHPDDAINRAEFVKIIVSYLYSGEKAKNIEMCHTAWSYSDVSRNAWYGRYFCRANDDHLIGGYPDGTFHPDAAINFAEAAKIISLSDSHNLLDSSVTEGPWYRKYVDALAKFQAIPKDIRSFSQQMTRGQMVEILYRLAESPKKDSQTYQSIGQLSGFAQSNLCSDPPTDARIGPNTYSYPKKEEYSHLEYLGEIFTADECGAERLKKAFGDLQDTVAPEPWLTLKSTSPELHAYLMHAGFTCQDRTMMDCNPLGKGTYCSTRSIPGCLQWAAVTESVNGEGYTGVMPKYLSLSTLLGLKVFASSIAEFHCPNCYIHSKPAS